MAMLIGDFKTFAIEVHHEPIPNASKAVFGRMCIHAGGVTLGDVNEPTCMLNVTEGHLSDALAHLPDLEDADFDLLSDREVFDHLDRMLYLDDDRTLQQLQTDSGRYFKFDFLTNGGESFDHTKSFISKSGDIVRLMFTDETDTFRAAHISQYEFRERITEFLAWIKQEAANVPV